MSTPPAAPAIPTGPGVYKGLSFSDYCQIDAVNASLLEGFMRTPAHAREAMLHPTEGTKAQAFGQAFHTFVLEPLRFPLLYAVPPKIDRRFKVGKEEWKAWEDANPGRILLKAEEAEALERMAESVMAHGFARELLAGAGLVEVTIIWIDPRTGLKCKGRLDRVAEHPSGYTFISDLKTAEDAEELAFSKSASKYGYMRQICHYRDGMNVLRPRPRRCVFIACEKEPPYAVACHEVEDRALEQAQRENASHLATFKHCTESGSWPAYGDGCSLIDYPAWTNDSGKRNEE